VISTQKQPGCKKKGAPLFKMSSMKEVVKSKGVAKKWLWWYRLMAKILLTIIQVNFVLNPSEAGMRQHKLTWIVVIKIFSINLYHHSHFLAASFDFTTFFILVILNRAAPFTARLFLSRYVLFTGWLLISDLSENGLDYTHRVKIRSALPPVRIKKGKKLLYVQVKCNIGLP